jgi:hypothetical protein
MTPTKNRTELFMNIVRCNRNRINADNNDLLNFNVRKMNLMMNDVGSYP